MVLFTPTEVGTHLPTSEGWRAELAQVERLHQTFDKSTQSWTCLNSITHHPLSGSNSSWRDGLRYKQLLGQYTSVLPTELNFDPKKVSDDNLNLSRWLIGRYVGIKILEKSKTFLSPDTLLFFA